MLKIGEFSKLSRISIRMLRHYDELGLLTPQSIDPLTGYRYYSESQLPTAGRIRALREMGFGLSAIGEILRQYDDPRALAGFLTVRRAELLAEAGQLQQRLRLLDCAIDRLRKDGFMMHCDVTLKTLPRRQVASVRAVIPAYNQEGILWQLLLSETAALNLADGEPCWPLAMFHDREYKEQDVDVEVQKMVRGSYPDTAHVRFKTLPPVQFASATYQGGYDRIGEVNAAVALWIRDNGYRIDGPQFNIYHVSPHETSDPDRFVTEVCYPVCKA